MACHLQLQLILQNIPATVPQGTIRQGRFYLVDPQTGNPEPFGRRLGDAGAEGASASVGNGIIKVIRADLLFDNPNRSIQDFKRGVHRDEKFRSGAVPQLYDLLARGPVQLNAAPHSVTNGWHRIRFTKTIDQGMSVPAALVVPATFVFEFQVVTQ